MKLDEIDKIKFPLYEASFSGFPTEELFRVLFSAIPSVFNPSKLYSDEIINELKKQGFEETSRNTINAYRLKINIKNDLITKEESLFINENKQIFIVLNKEKDETDNLYKLEVFYNLKNGVFYNTNLYSNIIENFERPKTKHNINIIKNEHGPLDHEGYDIIIPELDVKTNYGEDFLIIHDYIVERLNSDNDKGIVLLHGEPGTGKTNYLRYLTKLIENKDIYFIPPNMIEILTDPSFVSFLMERKNSILIIEDGEKVITDRNSNGSSVGVSNILNITDGIMGDCLNIQIIITFNMERSKIDNAMVRKGRLIAEHKFDKLTIKESNTLLKKLGKIERTDKPLTLAEIYNIDEKQFITQKDNKIGFK